MPVQGPALPAIEGLTLASRPQALTEIKIIRRSRILNIKSNSSDRLSAWYHLRDLGDCPAFGYEDLSYHQHNDENQEFIYF